MLDANEIDINNMKCTCPMRNFALGTQRHLYSTDWRRGLESGVTQILGLVSVVTQIKKFVLAPRYQHVGIFSVR